MNPFIDSTDIADNSLELRKRMELEGYLFFRGLMPADKLESLRRQLLDIVSQAGWLKKNVPLNDFCKPEQIKDLCDYLLSNSFVFLLM